MKLGKRSFTRLLLVVAALVAAPVLLHFAVRSYGRLTPTGVEVSPMDVTTGPSGQRMLGASFVRERGRILEVGLEGSPEQMGYAHARLLHERMVKTEAVLYEDFERRVSHPLVRLLLLDAATLRYAKLDQGMDARYLRELEGEALGFRPDPFERFFPTYQRFVYLNALYDIALSFEGSPLVGCTSFVFRKKAAAKAGALLARAFDFDVHDVFDEDKVLFLVRGEGRIPFASVAWPGFVGVVSGMNLEGLSIVVHGGRAGEPRTSGEPVAQALRRVLETAQTAEQAVSALREREPMVSHIVVLADASGRTAVVERVPGRAPFLTWLPERAAVTNHFEGGAADDPKNLRVLAETTTLARRRRADQLVDRERGQVSAADAVRLLRDRKGLNDVELPLGDRRAIDALIAAHGVVFETATRMLWVSEAPHLGGRFLGYDLRALLEAPTFGTDRDPLVIDADPAVSAGQYRRADATH
jgi:hypothetical protein